MKLTPASSRRFRPAISGLSPLVQITFKSGRSRSNCWASEPPLKCPGMTTQPDAPAGILIHRADILAVESRQSLGSTQPQVAIARRRDGVDGIRGQPIITPPGPAVVMAIASFGIHRENATAP